ncbi:unnamed protein product, partial [Effrenium voratum]
QELRARRRKGMWGSKTDSDSEDSEALHADLALRATLVAVFCAATYSPALPFLRWLRWPSICWACASGRRQCDH